ncbi:methionine synthase [Schwartzia sp. (in: firmicutes)]
MPVYNARIEQININEMRRYAGLQKVVFSEERLEAARSEALLYIEPKGFWELYDYNCKEQIIIHGEKTFHIESETAGAHLRGAEKIICLSATIGHTLEDKISEYFQRDEYTHGLLLDAAATAAVEQTADALEHILTPKAAAKGYKMHWRYSPGYGDWPIEAQADVLPLCHGEQIGIQLTEAKMLSPVKSITAVIGLYPSEGSIPSDIRGCASCKKQGCVFRRTIINNRNG